MSESASLANFDRSPEQPPYPPLACFRCRTIFQPGYTRKSTSGRWTADCPNCRAWNNIIWAAARAKKIAKGRPFDSSSFMSVDEQLGLRDGPVQAPTEKETHMTTQADVPLGPPKPRINPATGRPFMTFLKADGSVKNRTGWRDGWPIKKNGEPNMKPRRRRWGHYKKGTTAYRRMMSRRMREVLARKNGMPKPAAPTHDGLNGWTFVNVDSRKVVFIDMSNHVLVSGPSK